MRFPLFTACLLAACSAALLPAQDYRDRDGFQPDPRFRPGAPVQLGVRVRNTETGVELTQVLPGSPAERAGLVTGDSVLTVAGYQVGYVDGRLYDLGDEINRRMANNGIVRLMIRRQRTGQLAVVDAGVGILPPPGPFPVPNPAWGQGIVSGTIQTSVPLAVPAGSILQVQLMEEGLNGTPSIPVSEINLPNFIGFPGTYQLAYRQANLLPQRRYYLDVKLINGAQILCQSVQRYWFNGGTNVRLDMTVAPLPPDPNQNAISAITVMYRQYLGREPDPQGMQAHITGLQSGQTMLDVQVSLLASNEFFDRCRNNPQVFVQQLYQLVLNRQPSPQDMNYWTDQLRRSRGNRAKFIRDFLSAAARG